MKKVLLSICFLACAVAVMAEKNTGRVLASEAKGQIQNHQNFLEFQVLPLLQGIKDEKVELNDENFTDPSILKMAQEHDSDGDGALDQNERDSVTSVGLSGKGIQDPSGLYYFRKIKWLNLNENRIRNIELKNFPELEELYMNNNQLEALNGNYNTRLYEVTLLGNYNLKGSLRFVNSPNLKLLHCGDTRLEEIDLSENGALESFSASHTPTLRTIIYPKAQKSAKPLLVSSDDLYAQDFGEKGKHLRWMICQSGEDERYLEENEQYLESYGLTLKSSWEANEYTIEYQIPKEASFADPDRVIMEGKTGDSIQLPEMEIKEGYHFVKWVSNKGTIQGNEFEYTPERKDETVRITYVVEEDRPVIPDYIKINFQPGAENVYGTMESMKAYNGKRFYFPQNRYEKEGYAFQGWRLVNGQSIYRAGGSVYVSGQTQDIEVTAVWEKIKGVLIIGQKEKEIVQQYTLSQEDLAAQEKEGYKFLHWERNGKKVNEGDLVKVMSCGETIRLIPVYEKKEADLTAESAEEEKKSDLTAESAEEKAPSVSNISTEQTTAVKDNISKKKITKVSVSKISQQTYQNRPVTVKPVLKDGGQILREGKDYKITYYNNKGPGTAKIRWTGIGQYTGMIERSFTIRPKTPSVKVQTGKKSITVSGSSKKVSGYQISYSTSKTKNFKSVTSGKKYKIKNLKSKKTYYVKVRAYKTVQGKKIYSQYSKLIKVRVK